MDSFKRTLPIKRVTSLRKLSFYNFGHLHSFYFSTLFMDLMKRVKIQKKYIKNTKDYATYKETCAK